MCVLGWMNNASASYSQLNHVVASLNLHVRNQAIEERFGPASSKLVRHLLEEAMGQLLQGQAVETPLFEPFAGGVFLQDGSVVSLPNELSTTWRGSGGGPGESRKCRAHPSALGNALWRIAWAMVARCAQLGTARTGL